MRKTILLLAMLLIPAFASAEDGNKFSVEPRVETTFGNSSYYSVDAEARIGAPHGFFFTFGYVTSDDDSSKRSFTRRYKLEKEFDRFGLNFRHSRTPIQNGYESGLWGFGAAMRSDSEDFRTEAGFDGEVTRHGLKFTTNNNRIIHAFVNQRALYAHLTQRFWDTEATAELGNHSYNRDIGAVLLAMARLKVQNTISFSNTVGVLAGFPDTSQDYKLTQGLWEQRLSLWTGYSCVHLVTAVASNQRTSDSYSFGMDARTDMGLAGGFAYRYIRQTYMPLTRLYSFNLSWLFG